MVQTKQIPVNMSPHADLMVWETVQLLKRKLPVLQLTEHHTSAGRSEIKGQIVNLLSHNEIPFLSLLFLCDQMNPLFFQKTQPFR